MRPTHVFLRLVWGCLALLVCLAVAACSSRAPEFVTSDTDYSSQTARAMLDTVEVGDLSKTPSAEAPALRQEALSDLRGEENGDAAADFITKTFPTDTGGVPLYVERARYDSEAAWLVVEAIGRSNGNLEDKRLWVVGSDGNVLFSAID